MNINCTFQFKKVRKMQNFYIWGSPFVMSRTDGQNGVEIIFKVVPSKAEKSNTSAKCLLGIVNTFINFFAISSKPFAPVFNFSALLGNNDLNWNSCIPDETLMRVFVFFNNLKLTSCFPFFLFICSFKLCNRFCNIIKP